MPKGILIATEEDVPLSVRLFGGFEGYQSEVGGYIEAVDLGNTGATLFVNEEGKIMELPLNRRATLLWWLLCPHMIKKDVIFGDVILIGQPDHKGDTQDVPAELDTLLLDTKKYKVEFQTADAADKWNSASVRFSDFFSAANHALAKAETWTAVGGFRVVPD